MNAPTPLIGLSLSGNIKDIIEGKVSLDQVLYISAGTKIRSLEDLNDVISMYRQTHWRKDPDRGEQICRRLFAQGIVDQPRVRDEEPIPFRYGTEDLHNWMRPIQIPLESSKPPLVGIAKQKQLMDDMTEGHFQGHGSWQDGYQAK